MGGYQLLAEAIVARAIEDLVRNNGVTPELREDAKEFLTTDRCMLLTGIDGNYLYNEMKRMGVME